LCFAVLAIAAGLAQRAGAKAERYWAFVFPSAAALALLYFIPPPALPQPEERAGISILSYNVHHGFDDAGVPGMQLTARALAALNPDLIALQEIGRGWTLVGGSDLVGYLAWRFPDYEIFFAATNGQLWGNAILSRIPIAFENGGVFTAEPGVLKYGWTVALARHDDVLFPFYSVHLTADLEGAYGDPRTAQANQLLEVIGSGSPVVVAGDFNAHPQDEPIRLLSSALTDLGSAAGLAGLSTWPAGRPNERIDYVFARGFSVRAGSIPQLLTSDHLPVLLHVQPDRR
jgi:endonuclease/exonuclease/phosphatase family metal-dependent hydrolase